MTDFQVIPAESGRYDFITVTLDLEDGVMLCTSHRVPMYGWRVFDDCAEPVTYRPQESPRDHYAMLGYVADNDSGLYSRIGSCDSTSGIERWMLEDIRTHAFCASGETSHFDSNGVEVTVGPLRIELDGDEVEPLLDSGNER